MQRSLLARTPNKLVSPAATRPLEGCQYFALCSLPMPMPMPTPMAVSGAHRFGDLFRGACSADAERAGWHAEKVGAVSGQAPFLHFWRLRHRPCTANAICPRFVGCVLDFLRAVFWSACIAPHRPHTLAAARSIFLGGKLRRLRGARVPRAVQESESALSVRCAVRHFCSSPLLRARHAAVRSSRLTSTHRSRSSVD